MGALSEIGIMLVKTLAEMYLFIVILRFLFQVVRADFYNPLSQFVVKATNPPLKPLRRIIPGVAGIDFASVVLALLIQWFSMQAIALILGAGIIPPISAILWSLIGTISLVVHIYFWGMLAVIIVGWVAPQSYHPLLILLRQIIEPAMTPFRKLLPSMGGLDLSPILAFLALNVIRIVIDHAAGATGLPSQIVLGI